MRRLLLCISFLLMIGAAACCSKSIEKPENLENQEEYERYNMDIQCQFMLRNDRDEDYILITDEVIHNNLFYLLKATLCKDKIVVAENGEVLVTNSREIKITGLSEEDYNISFSIYYESKYNDGGPEAIIVRHGDDIQYYYTINQLYNFISLALTNKGTFEAELIGVERERLYLNSKFCNYIELRYDSLSEDITSGTLMEITLGRLSDDNDELYAESITVKQ